jgi:hypothetical protein
MSYELTAFVGRPEVLARIVDRDPVTLADGFALVPLDDDFLAARVLAPDDIEGVVECFGSLAGPASVGGTVAYLRLQTFGGTIDQSVVVWQQGDLVLCEQVEDGDADELPSNVALRLLGVVATGGEDEFATLGLGRHRDTEGWLADR